MLIYFALTELFIKYKIKLNSYDFFKQMKNIKFFQETQKATNPNFVKKGKLLNMKILKKF